MSNHMAKSVNGQPRDHDQRDEDDLGGGSRAREAEDDRDHADDEADDGQEDPESVEEDERVEVADDVLLLTRQKKTWSSSHEMRVKTAPEPDPRLLADLVDRPRRGRRHPLPPTFSGTSRSFGQP